jgi:predicted HTH domain antitoxin
MNPRKRCRRSTCERLAAAVKWYEVAEVSQGRAAEIAGVSRQELLAALGRYRVSPFQYTPEEVLEDVGRG